MVRLGAAGATGSGVTALMAPRLLRRLAAFLYEGLLLSGVILSAGLVYGGLVRQQHALQGRTGLQLVLLVVLAAYFTWFWSHGGQTVAMKAWHIRLVRADGGAVSAAHALARFLAAWLWFLPALATARLAGLSGGSAVAGLLLAGVLVYAALARLRPDRQFWHDAVCGTRLIDARQPPPATAK